MNGQLFHNLVAQYGKETLVSNGTDSDVLKWSGGVHCALPSLKFYGLSEQYGTPTPDNPLGVYGFTGPCYVKDGPYFNTPTLHGIGEYKDEWDYVTGKGVRRIKERKLTGTEGWSKYHWSTGEGYYSYRVNLAGIPNVVDTKNYRCLCTHYKPISGYASLFYGRTEGAYAGGVSDQNGWLVIGNSFPTVAEFKAFLAEQYANGTPVTVYYAIEEPQPFEERPSYASYQAIPNESGQADIIDGGMNTPFEVSYVTHSSPFKRIIVSSTNGVLEWSGGLSCGLPSLKLYGAMQKNGTTTPENPTTFYFNNGEYEVEDVNGFRQTITIPELKAVGISWYGYIRDELDYITGEGLRRIHKVVMDGESEYGKVKNVALNSSTNCYYAIYYPQYPQLRSGVYHINCTHFSAVWEVTHGKIYANDTSKMYFCHDSLTTVNEWNAWFKAQYDAGTPVTLYYAIAEPQPFEVQGGTLPNDGGRIQFNNSNITTPPPFDVTYITKR